MIQEFDEIQDMNNWFTLKKKLVEETHVNAILDIN